MVTLRTNKALTGPDLGIPSLTFQAFYEAKYGEVAWDALDKIPKEEWMAYLIWYRQVLEIPVRNSTRVDLIEHEAAVNGFKLTTAGVGCTGTEQRVLYARKVVLATGIQVGLCHVARWQKMPLLCARALP
eukprot:GHUV01027820.1.p1 GENE.GHUV01027820.1~~GHUV01027820.1.p1  ORF type:complete len:130 (+),score=28.74 GHUV01027820.1:1312-1701(+)